MSDEETQMRKCAICLDSSKGHAAETDCGGGHIFCHGCIKSVIMSHRKRNGAKSDVPCPLCRRPIKGLKTVTPTKRPVPQEQQRWQYAGRKSLWWDYSARSNTQLEEAWKKFQHDDGPSVVVINEYGGNLVINVDFKVMTQRTEGTGFTRKIQRLAPLPDKIDDEREIKKHKESKGCAGMPYDAKMNIPM